METAIWWIRRDLRLVDNPVLDQARVQAGLIIPVFILDNVLLYGPRSSEKRRNFLFEGLKILNEGLRSQGLGLILRKGEPVEELVRLFTETRANNVFAEPDHSPHAKKRDTHASEKLPITWIGSPAVQPPGRILKADGNPYTVFTPFSRAWKAKDLPEIFKARQSTNFNPLPSYLESLPVDEFTFNGIKWFPAGEVEARQRLERFTQIVEEETSLDPPLMRYGLNRDRLDLDDTSRLSPYIRFGMLSARAAVDSLLVLTQQFRDADKHKSVEGWLNEFIWRDFYIQILDKYPEVLRHNFRPLSVRWENDRGNFKAWCAGETGYPVVDAAMRQLEQSGWILNRARMITSSFLTRDLLIDWRWGEKWFMKHLIDGDPAANNGGWQWVSGTGTDTAPYFRIFNPVSQGLKHDPQGMFIRAWLPELEAVPFEYLHTPWTMPLSEQIKAGCRIGKDYPEPVVDHGWARQRALQAYRQRKE